MLMAIGCSSNQTNNSHQELLNAFYPAHWGKNDTLVFYAEQEEWDSSKVKAIADTLLQRYLGSETFNQLSFTGEALYFAGSRFQLDKKTDACVIYTHDFWFRLTSLLLFNRQDKKVLGLAPIITAQYYGGESGQIYSYSWLYLHKNTPRIFTKTIDHSWLMPTNDQEEPVEINSEQNTARQWKNQQFVSIALTDSVQVSSYFRLKLGDKSPIDFESQ